MTDRWFRTRESCPACLSPGCTTLYERPFCETPLKEYLESFYAPQGRVEFEYLQGASYVLRECSSCGLIFQRDVPGEVLSQRLYEIWIDPDKERAVHEEEDGLEHYAWYAREVMQIIRYFHTVPSELSFLDYGMGLGRWAVMAKAFGCRSYGFEFSRERVEHARRQGIESVSWEEIPEGRFDFINTEQVFEHVPDPLETLRHLARGLKPEGLLKISVPTVRDMKRRLAVMDWKAPKGTRDSLNPVAPLEHINHFGKTSLAAMAARVGMRKTSLPLKVEYLCDAHCDGLRGAVKSLVRPLARRLRGPAGYAFFRRD